MMSKTVLIGNNHLQEMGGSEIFTHTLIKAINELGYKVYFTTFKTGEVSKRCEEFATYIPPHAIHKHNFDKAILSHNSIVNLHIRAKSIIQICHGRLPGLEEPSSLANFHVVVSQGLVAYVNDKGFECDVINNPVDLSRFKPTSKIHRKPMKVLSLCQGEQADDTIRKACHNLGLEFSSFSKTREATWNLEDEINKVDIVVSIGRGIYEAMACARNVIVYDSRWFSSNKGDGYLTRHNFFLSHTTNCIGNGIEIDFNVEKLEKEFLKYSFNDGDWNYELAHYLFDAKKIAIKLLALNKPTQIFTLASRYFHRNMATKSPKTP